MSLPSSAPGSTNAQGIDTPGNLKHTRPSAKGIPSSAHDAQPATLEARPAASATAARPSLVALTRSASDRWSRDDPPAHHSADKSYRKHSSYHHASPSYARPTASVTACSVSGIPPAPATAATTTATPLLSTTPAGRSLQHAVQPQLSERDSIFATHYMQTDSPVNSPRLAPARAYRQESRHDISSAPSGNGPTMAVTAPQRAFMSPGFGEKDVPETYSLSYNETGDLQQDSVRRRPSRANTPLQYQRRSLYDIHDLSLLALNEEGHGDNERPKSRASATRQPSTPSQASSDTADFASDLERSTERQQYRSWRTGKAKMEGLTIAQSQRPQSITEPGVEKVIDAQLPLPEPSMANVRSRKASHFLGLFRDHEAEERRHEKHKSQWQEIEKVTSLDTVGESSPVGPDAAPTDARVKSDPDLDRNLAVSATRQGQNLPLGLLEEIRNHHHLAPGSARKISYHKNVPAHDTERLRSQERNRTEDKVEDEESDREHISSATYFPHQGVVLGDSPTEELQQLRRPSTLR